LIYFLFLFCGGIGIFLLGKVEAEHAEQRNGIKERKERRLRLKE